MRHHLFLGDFDSLVARHLVGNGIGGAQLFLDQAEHLLFERCVVWQSEFARFLCSLLRKTNDGLDDRLEMAVAEHYGAEHDVFGQLLGLRLDH